MVTTSRNPSRAPAGVPPLCGPARFTNASSVEVAYDKDWKHMRCPLASITVPGGGGSSLNVNPGCFVNNNTSVVNRGFPFNGAGLPKLDGLTWVENAYQLLDADGEFYLDTAANHLYYKPRAGEDLSTADVELPVLDKLVDAAGTPGHLTPVNDNDSNATYTGSWSTFTGRNYGDLHDDVHATSADGSSVSYTFTGTGLDVLSEVNSDEGGIDVYVDGTRTQSVSAAGSTRLAQQVIASVSGLTKAQHTVKLVKTSGTFMVIDRFDVRDRLRPRPHSSAVRADPGTGSASQRTGGVGLRRRRPAEAGVPAARGRLPCARLRALPPRSVLRVRRGTEQGPLDRVGSWSDEETFPVCGEIARLPVGRRGAAD